jgi:hypothetical protein
MRISSNVNANFVTSLKKQQISNTWTSRFHLDYKSQCSHTSRTFVVRCSMAHLHQWSFGPTLSVNAFNVWPRTCKSCECAEGRGGWHQRIFCLLHVRARPLWGDIIDIPSTSSVAAVFSKQSPIQVFTACNTMMTWLTDHPHSKSVIIATQISKCKCEQNFDLRSRE